MREALSPHEAHSKLMHRWPSLLQHSSQRRQHTPQFLFEAVRLGFLRGTSALAPPILGWAPNSLLGRPPDSLLGWTTNTFLACTARRCSAFRGWRLNCPSRVTKEFNSLHQFDCLRVSLFHLDLSIFIKETATIITFTGLCPP